MVLSRRLWTANNPLFKPNCGQNLGGLNAYVTPTRYGGAGYGGTVGVGVGVEVGVGVGVEVGVGVGVEVGVGVSPGSGANSLLIMRGRNVKGYGLGVGVGSSAAALVAV